MSLSLSAIGPAVATASNPIPPGLSAAGKGDATKNDGETREAFDSFVGQLFFGQMLKAMRKTVGKPAYFHGGQTEEIFQQQLDQVLGEKLSEASRHQFSGPMFDLFMANMSRQK